ncbi:MAG: hypothetical protein ABFD50_01465 [Smithella sp.]
MFKKIITFILIIGVLLIGTTSFAMTKAEKNIIYNGKITAIKGNKITVTDEKNVKTIFEVKSVEGLTVGTKVWCEDDCRRGLKINEKIFNVRKIMK